MKNSPPVADRVLIIRLGALGDVVRTLPAVASLRTLYPGSHLTWLVEPAAAGAVEAAGLVDEVLTFPRGALVEALRGGDALLLLRRIRRFLRILRERRFELSIDFHGLLKSGLLAWLSGAPVRYGYSSGAAREGSAIFANRRTGPLSARLSRFDRNEALVGALGPEPAVQTRPLLVASALAQARLTARLRAAGREHSRGFVLLHPGSSAGARYKRYAPGAWSEVAKSLAASGFEVWIAAGPSRHERGLAEEVVRRAEGALVLAPETRSFEDLLALQARAASLPAPLSQMRISSLSASTSESPMSAPPCTSSPHSSVAVSPRLAIGGAPEELFTMPCTMRTLAAAVSPMLTQVEGLGRRTSAGPRVPTRRVICVLPLRWLR